MYNSLGVIDRWLNFFMDIDLFRPMLSEIADIKYGQGQLLIQPIWNVEMCAMHQIEDT